ncbi:fumarylacetoacetate hydrolase family protein [Actinomadura madurae]|uniref:fumarylacetoacetate hydrolase family protein n=1 Tax=Actinomadura madurae TaxID=1993 RepID=UPI002109E15E|nr:fumarylacetoacetate hydrolase family protein [Actinomadura madurae]
MPTNDAATTLGPWLMTADEFVDRVEDGRLALCPEVRLNETCTGGDTTANMSWSFADLVAYASRCTAVRPGDVLGSGTCGTGCIAELNARRPGLARSWRRRADRRRRARVCRGQARARPRARFHPPDRRRIVPGVPS